jgi:hypothetical protein
MVNTENSFFVEPAEQNAVEPLRADEVRPKWFFHDDARPFRDAAGLSKLLHDGAEQRWRNRKVKRRSSSVPERLSDGLECGGLVVVAIHVAQQAAQFHECSGVKAAMLFETILGAGRKLAQVPTRFGDANDRHVEVPALQHRMERWEDFFVGQVAGGAEKHQRI